MLHETLPLTHTQLLFVAGGAAAVVLILVLRFLLGGERSVEQIRADGGLVAEDDGSLRMPQPNLKTTRFGWFSKVWRIHRHYKKRKKLANKGYVEWYLIDGVWPEPKFIQPEDKGGGLYEYETDGNTYLFPARAMMPNERQGIRTVVHKKGEADPVNLRDPSTNAIPADVLDEYLQLRPTSSPPSWLSQFDVSAEDMVKYAIAAVIAIAVLQGVL